MDTTLHHWLLLPQSHPRPGENKINLNPITETHLSYASVVDILSDDVWVLVCIDLCQEAEHGVIHCSCFARSSHV